MRPLEWFEVELGTGVPLANELDELLQSAPSGQ